MGRWLLNVKRRIGVNTVPQSATIFEKRVNFALRKAVHSFSHLSLFLACGATAAVCSDPDDEVSLGKSKCGEARPVASLCRLLPRSSTGTGPTFRDATGVLFAEPPGKLWVFVADASPNSVQGVTQKRKRRWEQLPLFPGLLGCIPLALLMILATFVKPSIS
jgi:hypothetical protein